MLNVRWLGRIAYDEALALQEEIVSGVQAGGGETLLLLEHDPVFTIGRTADQSSLRDAQMLPYPVRITNRGGQGTYHGPGQLVGYPILDLRRRGQDLHRYLRNLEQLVIRACATCNVSSGVRDGLTGVWADDRKIASIGVGVRRWISMHGFALNVTRDCLSPFEQITPCGIQGVRMTCMEEKGAIGATVRSIAEAIEQIAEEHFDQLTPIALA